MSHDSEHDKKCYEYYRTKCLKLQEQLNTEQEKANEAVREYCLLIQKSDKAQRVRIQAAYQKQQDTFSKRASHLNKKIDSSRKKMEELSGGRSSSKAENRQVPSPLCAPEPRSLSVLDDRSSILQKEKLSNESLNSAHNEEPTSEDSKLQITDLSEQLAERSKQLETDVFDYTDNQQLEIQQLKNQINEMSEKFEYDNRRIQREFNEKLDNIYECIEKLELGRLRAEKARQEPEAIAGLKDAVIAIFTGVLALIFYILTFLTFLMAPLTKNPLRSTVAIIVLIFAIIFYSRTSWLSST
ncbi:Oidioi.mRNA.OKI2018_I69.chr2.g7058.t1.cds [Oikopleura dioica]|uniref:Oidioi.mRNA.OKI2018_I69.chr2.g7058.t1.cds n=1 Tax=Oikopleura dioica TaxID=34765 RepID=A0ABN7T5E3_OIKDI|nr:Oidioi.mRNA.OKI2018_I69.chr2.g7058.t1.cds [Oikopleura dioica]